MQRRMKVYDSCLYVKKWLLGVDHRPPSTYPAAPNPYVQTLVMPPSKKSAHPGATTNHSHPHSRHRATTRNPAIGKTNSAGSRKSAMFLLKGADIPTVMAMSEHTEKKNIKTAGTLYRARKLISDVESVKSWDHES
jgi:hypothetical protein